MRPVTAAWGILCQACFHAGSGFRPVDLQGEAAMQQSTQQQPVTVSSLLGLMALAIAAGRGKAKADAEDRCPTACAAPARPARTEAAA